MKTFRLNSLMQENFIIIEFELLCEFHFIFFRKISRHLKLRTLFKISLEIDINDYKSF